MELNRYQQKNVELEKKKSHNTASGGIADDFSNLCGFSCCSCGEEVSPAVVRFFHFDVRKLQCYGCQQRNVPIPSESELKIVLPTT